MARLTWQDVVFAHRAVRAGLYRSEQEIFEREAEVLNSRLAPTLPVSATRALREDNNRRQERSVDVLPYVVIEHERPSQDLIARKLSGYDDATWSKLREDRKRTYRRAADKSACQRPEFMKLFEVKE